VVESTALEMLFRPSPIVDGREARSGLILVIQRGFQDLGSVFRKRGNCPKRFNFSGQFFARTDVPADTANAI
jgi:hypothetical protein